MVITVERIRRKYAIACIALFLVLVRAPWELFPAAKDFSLSQKSIENLWDSSEMVTSAGEISGRWESKGDELPPSYGMKLWSLELRQGGVALETIVSKENAVAMPLVYYRIKAGIMQLKYERFSFWKSIGAVKRQRETLLLKSEKGIVLFRLIQ